MELTCPHCRHRGRHPPNQILGHWAICPNCGAEIDWRALTPALGVPTLSPDVDHGTNPHDEQEND
jgi:hypothetical protein